MNKHYYDKNILSDDLVLLNDKLVTERLSDEVSSDFGVPTVASHGLVQCVYSKLDSRDNEISGYAQDISATAKISAEAALESINTTNDNITALCASAADVGKFNFEYNKNAQKIYIRMESATGVSSVKSIDTSDFIKDGMVDNAYFTPSRPDPEHPEQSLTGRWICIVFNTSSGKDPVYVDVDKLVPIVGDGLSTSTSADNQAMINVDWTKVARAETLTKTVKFVGEIAVQEDSELSTYLRNQSWSTEDRLENGAWIAVSSSAETKEMTLKGVSCVIENGDYLVVHDRHIENRYVKIEDLTLNDTLYIVRSNVTYAQLSLISSDLDQRLVAEITRAEEAESQLENDLSQEVVRAEAAEMALQENIDTEIERAKDAEDGLSERIDEECERATSAETELEAKFNEKLANETTRALSVEAYLSNEVSSEVARAQTVEGDLSAEILSCSASYDKLCAIIATEVATRTDIDNELSDAVRQKVFISSYLSDDAVSGYSDLSVIKLPKDEYDRIVANPTPLCGNTLYVVDSDYIDAYGQQIKNVSMNEDSFDADDSYLGIAATDTYVNKKCQDLNGILSNMISSETDDRISADKELSDDYNAKIAAEVARAFDIEGRISSEVSSIPRVKVLSSYDIEILSGVEYADALSVVNVTNYEYDKLVADEKIKDTMLYVIKDDFIDARGQRLENLADPVDLSDAVNKAYADGRVDGIKSTLNSLAYELSAKISVPTDTLTLNDIIMTIVEKLSAI